MNLRRRPPDVLAISEAELVRLNDDLDQLHHDVSLPALDTAIGEWVDAGRSERRLSRRNLLLGTGAAAVGGVLLAACGSSGKGASTSTTATATAPKTSPAHLTGDLAVAAVAASLENLGVYAYKAGITAAQAGKLGSVPPAVKTFATTAMAQHQQHAAAWNAALTGAGQAKVTETDPALTPTVNQKFAQVTDVAGLANLALLIENIAAQTYQASITELSGAKAIATSASIHPVEMQHAAILNLVLGNYPVPAAFGPVSAARSPQDLR
ncbi:MAG: ferritin-like domain-containing protein [Acidimicrobiales bacterium]